MARVPPLLTRKEEIRGVRLARAYPESRELSRLVASVRRRVMGFAAKAPEVRQIIGNRRHRLLGADLYVEQVELDRQGILRPRHAEVGIYDYDQDVLVSVIVDLKRGRVVRVEKHPGFQPPPSRDEEREAEGLALKNRTVARRIGGKRVRAVVLPAREASTEGHPSYGHRVVEVTFWTRGRRPEQVAGPVVVDLSRRALIRQPWHAVESPESRKRK